MEIVHEQHLFVRPDHMPYSVVEMRRLYGCDPKLIASKDRLDRTLDWITRQDVLHRMAEVTRRSGFELMDVKLIRFGVGEGITLAQLLAESLSDMHTYPEVDGCAHLWLDYCCFHRDNSDKAARWWEGNIKLLKPTKMIMYPTIYVPVRYVKVRI